MDITNDNTGAIVPDNNADTTTPDSGATDNSPGVTRRVIVQGAAWSIPIIAATVAVPAAAMSIQTPTLVVSFNEDIVGVGDGGVWLTLLLTNADGGIEGAMIDLEGFFTLPGLSLADFGIAGSYETGPGGTVSIPVTIPAGAAGSHLTVVGTAVAWPDVTDQDNLQITGIGTLTTDGARDMVMSPDGKYIYYSDSLYGVARVDTATGLVSNSIFPIPSNVGGLANNEGRVGISDDGKYLFVNWSVNYYLGGPPGSVAFAVYDVSNPAASEMPIVQGPFNYPPTVAIDRPGFYVVGSTAYQLIPTDGSTYTVHKITPTGTSTFTVPKGAYTTNDRVAGVYVNPDQTRMYVQDPGRIRVYNLTATPNPTLISTISLPSINFTEPLAQVGNKLFLREWRTSGLGGNGKVVVLNTDTGAVAYIDLIGETSTGPVQGQTAFNWGGARSDGKYVYVYDGSAGNAYVRIIRTSDNSVVATVPAPSGGRSMVISPDGLTAYVAQTNGWGYYHDDVGSIEAVSLPVLP